MQLLSNKQKSEVCQLAREAWDAHPEIREPLLEANLGREARPAISSQQSAVSPSGLKAESRQLKARPMSASDVCSAWRRVEQGRAVGRQSLTQCSSEGDFLRLCAHFRAMIPGQEQRAARTLARAEIEPRLVALHKLRQACDRAGVDLGYPAKICRTQYRCTLDQASERQLWNLFYTVRKRGTVKRREAAAAVAQDGNPF